MNASGIDVNKIQSMIAQLKAAAERPNAGTMTNGVSGTSNTGQSQPASHVDFSEALKASLNQVNNTQAQAEKLGQQFAMGDDSVSLSDVMIAGQKANIAFQATVQVRNKLVTAYQNIMNMQI